MKNRPGANKLINGTGGWIARDANWEEIKHSEYELKIIEEELALRR